MQVHRGAHHLGHVDRALEARAIRDAEREVLRTDAERDGLGLHVVGSEMGCLVLRHLDCDVAELDGVVSTGADEVGIEEVHLRHADEACDEEVGRRLEDLLRGADLLDLAVLHDDNAVAQGHCLGLVVRDVHEGRIDLLAQLDDLCAHLVPELCVEVRERLVHEEDLRLTHDGAADSDTLALAAGEGLRLAVEVLGDAQGLCSLADLLVDLVLRKLPQLQRECHVVVDGHVRVEGIGLEDHCDIAVLRRHVVHELAVDVELAAGDGLKACNHAQGRGLAAAGRSDEHDELAVLDLEVEVLDRDDTFVRDLEVRVVLLLRLLLAEVLLLGGLRIRIDLGDVPEAHIGHATYRPFHRGESSQRGAG